MFGKTLISTKPPAWVVGIIGGSGVYDMALDKDEGWQTINTNWGAPSDQLRCGWLQGVQVVFLPRHGRGHKLPPHKINYRANVAALKQMGVRDIISLSACGSLNGEMKPGDFVVVDQFIDRTSTTRHKSFFEEGVAVHVPFSDPTSKRLRGLLAKALVNADCVYHTQGTYIAMQGPQFSTRAESELHKSWGADVVGMTNMPEAKLAREAELPYSTLAMVTDFDSWSHESLKIEALLKTMGESVEKAKQVLQHFLLSLPEQRDPDPEGVETILDSAIITVREKLPADFAATHQPVVDRFLAKR